jgi:hypothetical protein
MKCPLPSPSLPEIQSTAFKWPHVTSYFEVSYVDGCTKASPATSDVASGDETVYVDGSAQADVVMCHVASAVDVGYVNGIARTYNIVVQKRTMRMADEMAQMVDVDKAVRVPAAQPPTAPGTYGPLVPLGTELSPSKSEIQVRMIIVPIILHIIYI